MANETSYELLYFPVRGRAELVRLIFAYTGTPYTDKHVAREDFAELKPTLPLGQIPVLYERSQGEELVIPQTHAIVRHLSRTLDLYGSDEGQRTRCDVVAETALDLRNHFGEVAYAPKFLRDTEATARHYAEIAPVFFARLERLLAATEGDFFVGEKITFADLMAFDVLELHLQVEPSCLDAHAALARFVETVRSQPTLAAYLAGRGPTDFEVMKSMNL